MPRKTHRPHNLSRRHFLGGMASAGGALALPGCGNSDPPGGSLATGPLPVLPSDPASIGIDHIVVVMMENRSFDHFLGWAPGSNGVQSGLVYPDSTGSMHPTFRLSQNPDYGWQGCGWADPDHGYNGGRIQYNGGRLDGWLLPAGTAAKPDDRFPIGYYTADDLPFYKAAVENFTICDRYFCSILSQTFPNRFYMHAGQTDRNDNALTFSTLETIWDRLAAKSRSGMFYFNDVPFIGLFRDKYMDITQPFSAFQAAAAAGTLADVSYIDPNFGASVGEAPYGVSQDDHPQADIRAGQAFLNSVYEAIRTSPNYENTLLIINYDEWGGFYDTVAPPIAPVTPEEFALIGNDGRLGFRVPCVLMGPRARKGYVAHEQFDHNSILNFICWRFGLDGLGARTQTSNNLAYALKLDGAARSDDPPAFVVPTGPFGGLCEGSIGGGLPPGGLPGLPVFPPLPGLTASGQPKTTTYDLHQAEWQALYELTKKLRFPVPQ